MTRGTTICTKHDKIMDLAYEIISFGEDAKEDGQSMENGLKEKNKEIEELNDNLTDKQTEYDDLQNAIYKAIKSCNNDDIDSLKSFFSTIESLV